MKRTLENCKLIRMLGPTQQYDGKCEGFGRTEWDDEPHTMCKRCPLHYINAENEEAEDLFKDFNFESLPHEANVKGCFNCARVFEASEHCQACMMSERFSGWTEKQ